MKNYYKTKLFTFLSVMLVFLLVNFVLALTTKVNFIDIGLPNYLESFVVAIFSLALICLLVLEMWNL